MLMVILHLEDACSLRARLRRTRGPRSVGWKSVVVAAGACSRKSSSTPCVPANTSKSNAAAVRSSTIWSEQPRRTDYRSRRLNSQRPHGAEARTRAHRAFCTCCPMRDSERESRDGTSRSTAQSTQPFEVGKRRPHRLVTLAPRGTAARTIGTVLPARSDGGALPYRRGCARGVPNEPVRALSVYRRTEDSGGIGTGPGQRTRRVGVQARAGTLPAGI